MTGPETAAGIISRNAHDEIFQTDSGNAARFALLHKNIVRYVSDTDTWLMWNGANWQPDEGELQVLALTREVIRDIRAEALTLPDEAAEGGGRSPRARMLEWALRTESDGARRRAYKLAVEEPALTVTRDRLDSIPEHLVTPDCTVQLDTGSTLVSSPEHLNTLCTTVSYDPCATSPLLDDFLKTFVPDPLDQDVLFAVLGTMLRGGNAPRIFPFIVGHTTSGKSMLMSALHAALGSYICTINSSIFRGNLDDKPRPDLVRAMFTRIAFSSEVSRTWELHADQIKRLTGGEPVPYRNLYMGSVEHVPRFTPLIMTNEMPRIKGVDAALRRRILVLRFDHTIPPEQEDTQVKVRFISDEQCLKALLSRVVAGARSPLLKDGIQWDKIPARFALDTLTSFQELDHVGEWLAWLADQEIIQSAVDIPRYHCVKASDLHLWYTYWVKNHGDQTDRRDALNLRDLGRALRERGWESAQSAGTRWLGQQMVKPLGYLGPLERGDL